MNKKENKIKEVEDFANMLIKFSEYLECYGVENLSIGIKTYAYQFAKEFLWDKNNFINKLKLELVESVHKHTFSAFHSYRRKYSNKTIVSLNGKEMNEIIKVGKIKAKQYCNVTEII